jgi:hypothetical protein
MALDIDSEVHNADWTKGAWDLPPYRSEAFMTWLRAVAMTLDHFRTLPVYQNAVATGLIVDDEWVGEGQR